MEATEKEEELCFPAPLPSAASPRQARFQGDALAMHWRCPLVELVFSSYLALVLLLFLSPFSLGPAAPTALRRGAWGGTKAFNSRLRPRHSQPSTSCHTRINTLALAGGAPNFFTHRRMMSPTCSMGAGSSPINRGVAAILPARAIGRRGEHHEVLRECAAEGEPEGKVVARARDWNASTRFSPNLGSGGGSVNAARPRSARTEADFAYQSCCPFRR